MPKSDRTLDKTHLSIDQAEERGFIHRDYIAHCLRWSHVVKFLYQGNKYKTARILDIGCGKEMPLAKLLHSSRLAPTEGYYIGLDANSLEMPSQFKNSKWQPQPFGKAIFPQDWQNRKIEYAYRERTRQPFVAPDIVTCFEVAEHVEPKHCRILVEGIRNALDGAGTAFISTPVWDPEVGAAANHINEMTYQAFGALLEDIGFVIEGHWGTFASQKDYKVHIQQEGGPDTYIPADLWNKLSQYYDSNYLATIFAPLFPQLSRNVLWRVKHHTGQIFRQFPKLKEVPGPWTSSPKWEELNG